MVAAGYKTCRRSWNSNSNKDILETTAFRFIQSKSHRRRYKISANNSIRRLSISYAVQTFQKESIVV